MLAKDNEYLQKESDSLYKADADEIIREKYLAREDAERRERTLKRDNRLLKEELSSLKKYMANLEKKNTDLKKKNADLKKDIDNFEKNIVKSKELVNELQDKLQKS